MLILTMSADGIVPVAFRCADGNTSDSRTHIQTWSALRALAGRADLLYVADSKLCSRENMDFIDRADGRFVTVLPRNRLEDQEFRAWIQTHTPDWVNVWDRPHARRASAPRDRWFVWLAALPLAESWPVVWVWSTLLALRQEARRRRNIAAATEELQDLRLRRAGAKASITWCRRNRSAGGHDPGAPPRRALSGRVRNWEHWQWRCALAMLSWLRVGRMRSWGIRYWRCAQPCCWRKKQASPCGKALFSSRAPPQIPWCCGPV